MIYQNLDISLPCKFDQTQNRNKLVMYSIIQNWTLTYTSPLLQDLKVSWSKDPYAFSLKVSLDSAVADYFSKHDIRESE